MTPFTTISGAAVPMLENDINTDQIAPVPTKRSLKPDYRELLFFRARRRDDDTLDPDFVLNRPQFAEPRILVAGHNFGCGSSREAAVWALVAVGIRCIIARSLADLYRENCLQNGVLPIELPMEAAVAFEARVLASDGAEPFAVDLYSQTISGPGGAPIPFEIAAADRIRLLEGLDDIGLTLKHQQDIAAWETRTRAASPWLQSAIRWEPAEVQENVL
ncbi:3-isopropylmalate dehydratase small subunit [Microvirga antarctica]|uniref:3-isopropylmalate dehydratase small subunit n=1 Tax=Microvirga antarctica TaxID=2819233 RepID=UPI001B311DA2|nr:3-isopropylmalate dehydratase small subunit [Microvirga antarctica]